MVDDVTRDRLPSRDKGGADSKSQSYQPRNGYGITHHKNEPSERVSSNDNDSNQVHSELEDVTVDGDGDADDDDLKFFEEMEEEEDYRRNQQYVRKEPTFRRQFQAPNILQLSSTIQEKGSLLEFLETNLREKFCSNLLPALSKSGSSAGRENGIRDNDDISSSDWALFIDEEEVDSRGIINQHLRGLTEWIHSTSTLLNSCISIENSNNNTNARTLMESEVQVFQTDVYFIEQVLERCEQEPTKESCIYSLEVIVKWIRGICHQKIYDDIDEGDQQVSSESKGDFRKSESRPSSSQTPSYQQNPSNLAKFHITLERLEQLFARCDYILNEQSKFTVAQILELISVLRDELNAISSGFTDRKRATLINRSNVVRDIIHFLCNQISLSRIHVYMLDIKAHINFFDSLASHLEALEVIWDELEAIKSWLTTVTMFLPPPRIDLRSMSTDTQVSRDPALTLQSHPKFEEAMRAAIQEEIKIALTSNQTASLHFHRFNQSHGAVLSKMLIELQACCLANKLLLLSEISSITMQKNTKKPRSTNYPTSHNSRLQSSNNLYISTSVSAPPSSSNIGNPPYYQKKAAVGIELHSKYNVVYEINIGTQFVDLMLKLESPSIVRAKLAFAAVCYLQCLQRDSLPWQSGKFNRIVLKKRNADGFNILKRGDSELGFGVDGDDIDYYIEDYSTAELERTIIGTFSSALGSIDEMKNLQSLLYEAAFDLFPHYRNFNSYQSASSTKTTSTKPFQQANSATDSNMDLPKKKPASPSSYVSPSSEMLFAHLTTSLDMNLSVHDKIKEKNPSSPPRSPRKASRSSRLNKSSSNDQASTFDHRAIILVNKRIKDFVPSRNKRRQLTHLMKYELFLFSFALLSQFVTAIYDVTPNLALELCDICARIAAHVDKGSEQIQLQKKAFLLAMKLGRCESAIKHGRQIWEIMFTTVRASSPIRSDHSLLEVNEEMLNTWEEFFFVTKNLVDQYFINAQYPLAMKVIVQALELMLSLQRDLRRISQDNHSIHPHKKPSSVFPKVILKRIDLENSIHALLLQQGKAYLYLNRFDSSLSVLQRTLLVIKGKDCTIKQLEWKVIFLSWMMQCFYEMRDYDCANLMIHCIKAVRSQEMKSFLQQYIGNRKPFRSSEWQRSDDQTLHQLHLSDQRTKKSRSRESALSNSVPVKSNPFLSLDKGYIEEEYFTSNKTSSLQDKKPTPRSFPQSRMKPNLSSESLSSDDSNLSQVLESSESMFQPFLGHAMTRRFLVNDSWSGLPQHCVTDHSFDLGAVQARIYFKRRLYEKALIALTPVILSTEVVGGGKGGSIDNMIELAELYLLRGQIQYEACRIFTSQSSNTATERIHFPFDVGSSQLLFNIHTLSLQIQDLVGKGRQERTSFQSCASKLLDRIQATKYRHFTQQPLKGIPPPLSAVVGSLTATNLTSKAKMIPYNNPADLLWDAMKWYRRAFDLFHAAGDQISAAKSANHIAECHLLPTFVPHLFFNLPLNVAIDLSLYQGVEAPLNLHRANTQPPISSPSTPSNASHHNDLHNIPFDHPQSSTTGTTRSAVSSVNAPTGNKSQQHHSPSAALHHPSTSKPPLPAANKTLAMSGATVVKRFASLEEVEKVSLFALEKFLEAYVCPLELIQSYLNLAEMMLITGNVQDSLHFWWEAKELFLHLFVDGCFIPISRVCSLDYLDKLVSVLDRIVRCLWKWDKNIRNSHLNLLEIHNLVNIERKRRAKRHTMTYQVNQQHVYEFLHHIFDAHTLLQLDSRNYTSKGESTATNTLRTSSTTSEAIGHNHGHSFTTASIPTSLSVAENKPVSSKKPRRKKKGVFAKIRKSFLSLVGRSDHIVADSRGDGFKSSPFLTSSNRQQTLQSHFDYHLIEGMIQDMCSDLKDKSDMAFYLDVIKPLISDRIMDFGWSNFIDYHKHMTFNVPNLAKSQSRDSVASSTDPRNRSTDSNIPIGGAMSSTRSSSILRLSTQTAASYRHSSHGKDKDDRFITEAVLNIVRRSSFQCKRMPRFLKPFTVTWGDIINSDSSFVKDEEEDKEIAFGDKGNGSDSLPQSNYLYNSGGEGAKRKSVLDVLSLSRDPLVNLLINEKPVDPLYDFDWMDDTYTLTYVPSLLVSRSTSRSTLESNLPEIGSELSSLSSFNEDSLRTIEATAERVLVYRVWALLQRNHNFMIAPYRRHALTFSTIGKIMRTSLSKISHNMLRLKAFSRQLKGSFLSFDHLLLLLQKNADFSSPSEATVHAPGTADFEGNDIASSSNKFLRLQYRLPKLLYMISVDNLLLAYHPFSSRETIQILNQDCLSFNHSSSFYQGLSGVSSASHSQSNYDLVSHKLSTNATHNASIAAIKATGSNAPILSTSFPQTTYPPHQIQTEGIATADDSFTTAMTDFKTSAIEFSDHQLCFLFDLFTQNYDYQCAGGYQNRHFLLQQLREQDLSGLLDFIRLCSDYDLSLTTPRVTELHQHYSSSIPLSQETINPIYKEDFAASTLESFSGDVMKRSSTDRVTRGMSMGIEVAMTMSLDNCLSSDDIRHPHKRSIEEDRMSTMFTSVTDQLPNNSSTSGPVTLICGSYPQLIPWEGILADLTIVRNIGLMPLVMQLLELEETQSSSKHAKYSNTQNLLPALSISNDDSITPISTPATSHPYGTSQLLSEERDREQERVSSYNSYASSSSSPSMSSNRHTHHNNSSLTEWKVRGSLSPSLVCFHSMIFILSLYSPSFIESKSTLCRDLVELELLWSQPES